LWSDGPVESLRVDSAESDVLSVDHPGVFVVFEVIRALIPDCIVDFVWEGVQGVKSSRLEINSSEGVGVFRGRHCDADGGDEEGKD